MMEWALIIALIVIVLLIVLLNQRNSALKRTKDDLNMMSSIIRLSNIKGVPPKNLGDFYEED